EPWVRKNPSLFRDIRHAVRGMLSEAPELRVIHPLPLPTSVAETATPLSLLWSPRPEEVAAHDRLREWMWSRMADTTHQMDRRRLAEPKAVVVPDDVVADFQQVMGRCLAAAAALPS